MPDARNLLTGLLGSAKHPLTNLKNDKKKKVGRLDF